LEYTVQQDASVQYYGSVIYLQKLLSLHLDLTSILTGFSFFMEICGQK
jgi:hypothetical protein